MAGDVTQLLLAHRDGHPAALERLVPLVYSDLRRMARAQMRGRAPGTTLETGVLVHEAYVRLVDQRRASWQDRRHFYAVAALAMRQIVIDHARRRGRVKRGGAWQATTLNEAADPVARDAEQLLDLDRALRKLESIDPRLVRIVECRYFAGLSEQETAETLELSVRTVQREWFKARAWLRAELTAPGTSS